MTTTERRYTVERETVAGMPGIRYIVRSPDGVRCGAYNSRRRAAQDAANRNRMMRDRIRTYRG